MYIIIVVIAAVVLTIMWFLHRQQICLWWLRLVQRVRMTLDHYPPKSHYNTTWPAVRRTTIVGLAAVQTIITAVLGGGIYPTTTTTTEAVPVWEMEAEEYRVVVEIVCTTEMDLTVIV